jgi:hypothetical protein
MQDSSHLTIHRPAKQNFLIDVLILITVMSWDRIRNREREQSLAASAQSLLSFY